MPTGLSLGSVTRAPSLSDKVAEQLTEAIVSQKIKSGERLPSERDLGEHFNVSRTVIREAVRSLVARGLVRVTSGRGVEASPMNSSGVAASMRLLVRGYNSLDYSKVHEVRVAVEVQTAGLAALRATAEDVARLRQLCDDQQRCMDKGDAKAASENDFQFHCELTRASGNELLVAMLDSISDVLREVRYQAMAMPHVGDSGIKAHRRILACVAARDPEGAREAMKNHLIEAERVWKQGAVKSSTNARRTKHSAKATKR